jgi:hypothetical protein
MPTRSKGRLMRCTVLDDANSSRFSAAARSPGRSERARRNRKRLLELAIYRPRTPRPHVSGLTLKESPARAGSFLGDFADAKGASSKPDSAQIPKRGFFLWRRLHAHHDERAGTRDPWTRDCSFVD